MTTIDHGDNAVILAVAKTIGFAVDSETEIFRMKSLVDFAYIDLSRTSTNGNSVRFARLNHYRSRSDETRFDVYMGFAPAINTIAVYVPTEAAS